MIKIGIGYDVHAFAPERSLMLGGVEIDYHLGLAGHSDADVLLHAIIDACLGASGCGVIGEHFPDNDSAYKNIDSTKLLRKTMEIIIKNGFTIGNIDTVIIAQEPQIMPYAAKMKASIAGVLGIELSQVNIKATTTENLGFEGRKEGIAAQAVVLLEKKER
jgi:2-C-methyl-D-erythritol 2,4-cyclodiphosphate synthase